MEQPISGDVLKTAVGVAGGSALIAPALPIAMPLIHGLAGIALVGAGIFAVVQAAEAISSVGNSAFNPKNQK